MMKKSFWDKIAVVYDLFERAYNRKCYYGTGARVAQEIDSGDVVLECACGTGSISKPVAKKCRKLFATDMSVNMMKRAGKKLCGEYIKPLFDKLSKKEQEILGRYFGVYGYDEMSAKEISELMLITPNAVNKSVNSSLSKLKGLYYKGSELFYWRNANWGFKDRSVLYFNNTTYQ